MKNIKTRGTDVGPVLEHSIIAVDDVLAVRGGHVEAFPAAVLKIALSVGGGWVAFYSGGGGDTGAFTRNFGPLLALARMSDDRIRSVRAALKAGAGIYHGWAEAIDKIPGGNEGIVALAGSIRDHADEARAAACNPRKLKWLAKEHGLPATEEADEEAAER